MSELKNLMRKEFRLVLIPLTLLFSLLCALLLVPNYPSEISFLYFFFPIQICFQLARENQDLEFTLMLPVPRKKIVLSKILTVASIQGLFLIVSVPFALLSLFLTSPSGNAVGLDVGLTLYGAVLLTYAVFNLVFFPLYYKTAKNLAKPLIFGVTAYLVLAAAIEVMIALIPALHGALDGSTGNLWAQFGFFAFGLAAYVGGGALGYRLSAARFEKVSV